MTGNIGLSSEDIEILKQAREAQSKLASLGIPMEKEEPKAQIPEQQKSYENFIEINNLPSRGIFYKEPVYGQALKVEDLLQIQNLTDENANSRFNEIFGRRIKGITPAEMIEADELYIALWLRESSYPGYTFPYPSYTCSKCGIEVPSDLAEFKFGDLKFKSNIEDIVKLYENKEFVEFPLKNGINCKMFPKRRLHSARVKEVINREFYKYSKVPPEGLSDLMELLSVCDFGDSNLKEVSEKFLTFDAMTFNDFVNKLKKYTLTLEIEVSLRCPNPKCLEVSSVTGYPFRPEIYFPDNP